MCLYNAKSDEEVLEGRKFHYHKEFEIYYMTDGKAEFILEGKKFFVVSDRPVAYPVKLFPSVGVPFRKNS